MDILQKISASFEAYADCALAMQMAGEKAEKVAGLYEDLAAECKLLGLPHAHYASIAADFRGIANSNKEMGFDDVVKTCMFTAEVCR